VDFSDRLRFYFSNFSMKNILKRSQSHICSALLKYGHANLSLTIIEYCDKEKCIEREDFYLSSLKHEYNICQKAGSSLGIKYSDETKTKISDALKGENNPNYGKPRAEGAGSPSQAIEVFNKDNNQTTTYDSICEAARALNITQAVITKYFSRNQKKPYKGQYTFNKQKQTKGHQIDKYI